MWFSDGLVCCMFMRYDGLDSSAYRRALDGGALLLPCGDVHWSTFHLPHIYLKQLKNLKNYNYHLKLLEVLYSNCKHMQVCLMLRISMHIAICLVGPVVTVAGMLAQC